MRDNRIINKKGFHIKKLLISTLIVFSFVACTSGVQHKIMIDNNASSDINVIDFSNQNALHDAVRSDDLELVEYLVTNGVALNKQDSYGYTALHIAVRLHNLEITQYLISKKAILNSVDKYQDTPLLDSVRNNDSEISKELICNGANRNVVDMNDISALHYSSKNKNIEITNLLMLKNLKEECNTTETEDEVLEEEETIEEVELSIGINEYEVINDSTPKICGELVDENIVSGVLTLSNDDELDSSTTYDIEINNEEQQWCVDVNESLVNGEYTLSVVGNDEEDNQAEAQTQTKVFIIPGLYDALNTEFENDFENWGAALDEDTLLFRFTNTSLLFNRGSKVLKTNYKDILKDFFPRYIKIVSAYTDDIEYVYIEGHASSEHSQGKTDEDKFELNRILSQKRADEVLEFSKNVEDENISMNDLWIDDALKLVDYHHLIYY